MDEVTKEWFSSARERYSGAVRFAFVLLAVLFGIQLTTFTEYLDTQARLRRAKAQAEEARALSGAMSEVAGANALQRAVTDNLKEMLNTLIEELKGDFAALDGKVADLRGVRPVPSEPRRNLAMQQLNAPGLLEREIVLGNDLEVKIREAPNLAEVLRLLTPWVEQNIVRLRFAEAVDSWKQREAAILEKADALSETLGKLKVPSATAETNSGFAQRLAQLRSSLNNFPARLAVVAFKPPANPAWWQTVPSKGATAYLLEEGALKVLQTGSANDTAARLAEAASQTQQETEAARKSLQEQLTTLEKSFEEQKQQAAIFDRSLNRRVVTGFIRPDFRQTSSVRKAGRTEQPGGRTSLKGKYSVNAAGASAFLDNSTGANNTKWRTTPCMSKKGSSPKPCPRTCAATARVCWRCSS